MGVKKRLGKHRTQVGSSTPNHMGQQAVERKDARDLGVAFDDRDSSEFPEHRELPRNFGEASATDMELEVSMATTNDGRAMRRGEYVRPGTSPTRSGNRRLGRV